MSKSDRIANIIDLAFEAVKKSKVGPAFYYFDETGNAVGVSNFSDVIFVEGMTLLKLDRKSRVYTCQTSIEIAKMIIMSELGHVMKIDNELPGDEWKKGLD